MGILIHAVDCGIWWSLPVFCDICYDSSHNLLVDIVSLAMFGVWFLFKNTTITKDPG